MALTYAVFGLLWIFLSDHLLTVLIANPVLSTVIQTIKGWGFVIFSALVIYFLLHYEIQLIRSTQTELEKSEERYRLLFQSIRDGVVGLDARMNCLYINEQGANILGRKPEDLVGKNVWAEFPEAEQSSFAKAYEHALLTQEAMTLEEYYAPLGRWFENRVYPSKDGLTVFFTDITERKQAETSLYASKEQLRHVLENAPDTIYAIDFSTGKTEFLNRDEFCGYTRAELDAPGSIVRAVHPADVDTVRKTWEQIRQGKDTSPLSYRVRRKDGEWVWVEQRTRAIKRNPDQTLKELLVSLSDITERKRAEEEQKKSDERNRIIAGMISDYAYIFAVTPKGELKGEWVTEAFTAAFGYTLQQVLAGSWQDLVYPPDLPIAQAHAQKVVRGQADISEMRWVTADGKIRWLRDYAKPIFDETGERVARVYGASQDITERKRAEEELEKRAKELVVLYRSAQRLQKLLSAEDLSHEIVNLLEKNLSYEYGAVLLLEETSGRLIPFAVAGQGKGEEFLKQEKTYILSHEPRLGRGITGWVAQHGKSLCLGDVQADGRYYGLRKDIHSEMCVPLLAGENVIGVINVETTRPNAYGEGDRRVLETIAAQISVAIQNARLLEETRLHRDRLAELSKKLVEARESEARAIGRELHDQIGQMLTALKITIEILPQFPPDMAAQKLAGAQTLITELMNRVSALSLELRPPMLDDLGLVPALLWHVNRFQEQTHLHVDFRHSGVEGRRFAPEIETTAYRVIQEALTNAARHARATRVRLEVHARGGGMDIQIEDDGAGFNIQSALAQNRGLGGIRERVGLVNGTFHIQSEAGRGAHIQITLPP